MFIFLVNPGSDKKQQHHNRQKDIPDIQVNIPVLQPAQSFEQRQHRPHHDVAHMQLGNVTDMAVVMAFLRESFAHL